VAIASRGGDFTFLPPPRYKERWRELRRQAILLLVAMGAALIVGSGVALALTEINCITNPCLGTPDSDNIQGTNDPEEIRALAGDDFVFPQFGNDVVYGDEGSDIVSDNWGNDTIYGGPDGDGNAEGGRLDGGEDSDTVYGGGGNDFIDAAAFDEPGAFPNTAPVDRILGGAGNDRIYAADGNVDKINCGKGRRDRAVIDAGIDTGIDTNDIRGCEKIVEG
jgi:Ca2+-binding RTX toxin-like protein